MVIQAGPLPPTIATLVVHYLRCAYSAPAVPLLYAYSIQYSNYLQRDSCRLVIVEVIYFVVDQLRRRTSTIADQFQEGRLSTLQQTSYRGRSSTLRQTSYRRGDRLLYSRLVKEKVVYYSRLVIGEDIVCSIADWLQGEVVYSMADQLQQNRQLCVDRSSIARRLQIGCSGGRLQLNSCRLVIVEVVYSLIAVDQLQWRSSAA